MNPGLRERPRYLGPALAPRRRTGSSTTVEGDEWFGFESVRILPDLDAEVLLIPLPGHIAGHTGVAIRRRRRLAPALRRRLLPPRRDRRRPPTARRG